MAGSNSKSEGRKREKDDIKDDIKIVTNADNTEAGTSIIFHKAIVEHLFPHLSSPISALEDSTVHCTFSF